MAEIEDRYYVGDHEISRHQQRHSIALDRNKKYAGAQGRQEVKI